MYTTYKKMISLLLSGIALSGAVHAQNTPETASAPSGSVTEIAPPPMPVINQGLNYIIEKAPMIPTVNAGTVDVMSSDQLKQKFTYLDGFNRVIQTVQSNVSLSGTTYQHGVQTNDTRFRKDQYGFLPYASGNLGLQSNAFLAQKTFYNGLYPGEGYTAYSKTASNGNRTSTSYAPGKSQVGQGRGTVTKTISNTAGQVRIWELDANGLPITTGTYNAAELFGEEVIAPIAQGSGNVTAPSSRVFTDKDGRVVLKMVADSTYTYGSGVPQVGKGFQSTYYVYDEKGQLRYTLPPKAVQLIETNGWVVSSTVRDNLCFQYRYDDRGRLSAQRFPGEGDFTYMIYDPKQRVVMVQTPNDKAKSQYQVTYYDKHNRVTATALYANAATPQDWQTTFDYPPSTSWPANDIRHYLGYPYEGKHPADDAVSGNVMLSYVWYDNYEGVDDGNTRYNTYNPQLAFTEYETTTGSEIPVRSMRTRGLVTATMHKILRSPNAVTAQAGDWTTGRNFYDDKGRLINYLKLNFSNNGGQLLHYQYSGTQYDFLNRPLISKSIFQNLYASAAVYTELSKNEYQLGTGALLKTSHKIGTGPWNIIAQYQYDALGRVKRKGLGGYAEVQDFSYNIRGQLTGINGDYARTGNKGGESRTFGEAIMYDYGFTVPQYNGKIAGIWWRGGNSATVHAYGYDYDLSGRLKNAEYRTSSSTLWNKTELDYTVSGIFYDKNGNLMAMDQRGVVPANGIQTIDKLRYNYSSGEQSNNLLKVSDAMPNYGVGDFVNPNGTNTDYKYNGNGNLTLDNNKGISDITYTHFNKPIVVTFDNGGSIEYSYDAAGNKLEEIILQPGKQPKRTDYVGSYIYENDQLQYILGSEGRSVYNAANGTFKEEFFVKDHLGNVRSTIDVIQYPLREYLATFELASANLEGLLFEQVSEIREDKPGSTDPNDTKSGRLNGEDRPIGTSLLMHVMAGDQVEMNVNNYYDSYDADNDDPLPGEQMLDNIVNTLTGGVGGFEGSEGHNPDMVQQLFTPDNYLEAYRSSIAGQVDQSRPKAYLNYILFDENMRIDKTFSNAFQVNSNGSWQEIGTATPLTIPTNGYLAIYLSNESRSGCYECNNVSFDLLRVKLQKGKQLEETHYYPFGLPMQGLSSAAENNTIPQRRKYQSNEYIKDLGLNWMDFHARQYDPQIGRFLGVDPLAASGGQDMFSPYAAMGNAPESMVDPNGLQQTGFSGMGNPMLGDPFGLDGSRLGGFNMDGSRNTAGGPSGGHGGGGGGGFDEVFSGWGYGTNRVALGTFWARLEISARSTTGKTATQGGASTAGNYKSATVHSGISPAEATAMGALKDARGNYYNWVQSDPNDLGSLHMEYLIINNRKKGSEERDWVEAFGTVLDVTDIALATIKKGFDAARAAVNSIDLVKGSKVIGNIAKGLNFINTSLVWTKAINNGFQTGNKIDILANGAGYLGVFGQAFSISWFFTDKLSQHNEGMSLSDFIGETYDNYQLKKAVEQNRKDLGIDKW